MLQLIIGSFTLSLIHALIPSHWLPFIAIGKTENWGRNELLKITALAGFAHVFSTTLIGILIGYVSYELTGIMHTISHLVVPAFLIIVGMIYIFLHIRHRHIHRHIGDNIKQISNRSKKDSVFPLVMAMFLSPCIEIDAYYLMAGSFGWQGILLVSAIYLVITILGMVILVDIGFKGVTRLNNKLGFLEHRENLITGIVFIVLGIFLLFVEL